MILQRYKGSIKKDLIKIILVVVFLTAGIGYTIFVSWYMTNQQQKLKELSQSIGLVLSQDFAKLILLNEVSIASDITTKLKSFHTLESMVLYNKDNTPTYQYSKNNSSFIPMPFDKIDKTSSILTGNNLNFILESKYQNVVLGNILFVFEIHSLWDIFKRDFLLLLSLSVIMFVVSYILAEVFAKIFTSPILRLVSFLEKVELNDSLKNQKISIKSQNEFGKLYDEINIMLQRIYLANQEQKIASVAFETQTGMTITDANQKILKVNKAFTQITGYEADEVIGLTPAILKSGFQDKEFYKNMWEILKRDKYYSGEIYNKNKNGTIYPEYITIQTVLDDDGDIQYYVASFLDISLQKNQERTIKEKENLLMQQSKMASMGEMIENIAHQWRQPLSMITTSSTSLKMQKELDILTNDDLYKSLDNITNAATHLSQTIDDFRSFFKEDKMASNFSIKESLEKSIILLTSKFKNKNIEVSINGDDAIVNGYRNEIIQVFLNILNNSNDVLDKVNIKEKLIIVQIETNEHDIQISFLDNGDGIEDKILPRVFDHKFTTKESSNGTGIGLYMSKLIIEKSKGRISVQNEEFTKNGFTYKGAKFIITLPKP